MLGIGDMYLARIHRPPNYSLSDFTQIIIKASEYTDYCRAVYECFFNIDVSNNAYAISNYVDTFLSVVPYKRNNFAYLCLPSTGVDT